MCVSQTGTCTTQRVNLLRRRQRVSERETVGGERVPYYQGMRVLIKHRSCRGPEVRCTCNEWRNLTHPIIGSLGKKSILLLWAERPNAKLIMSSKAPALCNVSVHVVCVSTLASVHRRCTRIRVQKIYNEVRVSRMCSAARWRCFIVCLRASVYKSVHTDTCICEFNFGCSCLQELLIWRCFNFPAVWCDPNWGVNK